MPVISNVGLLVMTDREPIPRPLSIVKLRVDAGQRESADELPFKEERALVFLGESPSMPGHCIIAGATSGRVYVGYHTYRFVELSDDEV
jgi:hypothetical protein